MIDLSKLPAPQMLKKLDYQEIFDKKKADFLEVMPSDYQLKPSDPAYKVLEQAAKRELTLRAEVNDQIKECLLAFASGSNLDHLTLFHGVTRTAGESDESLRQRALLSFDRYSTAGAEAAYEFQAQKAALDSKYAVNLADCKAYGKDDKPGEVFVRVLYSDHGKNKNNIMDGETIVCSKLSIIENHLRDPRIKPLTDILDVKEVEIIEYTPEATLYVSHGADPNIVLNAAHDSLRRYAGDRYGIGLDVTVTGLHAALSVPNVWDLVINCKKNMEISNDQAARILVKKENIKVEVKS